MDNASNVRVVAIGSWTFQVGPEFELIDNGDSVQAVHRGRVVYVSSLRVGTPESPPPAGELRVAMAARLARGKRFAHTGALVEGDAEIHQDIDAWRLQGTMCADGTVATCVIDFQSSDDRDWALAVWKSLRCEDHQT